MTKRFDYVKYDEESTSIQNKFKSIFIDLEFMTNELLNDSRYKSLVMTGLEQTYSWIGKSIKEDQGSREKMKKRISGD